MSVNGLFSLSSARDTDYPKCTNDVAGYVEGDVASAGAVCCSVEVTDGDVSAVCRGGEEPARGALSVDGDVSVSVEWTCDWTCVELAVGYVAMASTGAVFADFVCGTWEVPSCVDVVSPCVKEGGCDCRESDWGLVWRIFVGALALVTWAVCLFLLCR